LDNHKIDSLVNSIAHSLEEGIRSNGMASLIVCGGNSPLELYKQLSFKNLEWSKISILLGDDRVVDQAHSDSNEQLIYKNLLINNAKNANYISILHPQASKDTLPLPFDVVILGLGNDGHFASLFSDQLDHPSAFSSSANPDFIFSAKPLGQPAYKRVSMNLSMLLSSSRCILLVSNEAKRKIVQEGYQNSSLPIHFLLTQSKIKIEFSDVDF